MYNRYLHLMSDHDLDYWYSDDNDFWDRENAKRTEILMLRAALSLSPRGRRIVRGAEKKYGHV